MSIGWVEQIISSGQMPLPVVAFDDFNNLNLDEATFISAGTPGTETIQGLEGGVSQLSSGAAAADRAGYVFDLNWRPDRGHMTMEARVALITNVADAHICVGWTDIAAGSEMPFNIDGSDVVTAPSSNAACFVYDTTAATDRWFAASVNADTVHTSTGVFSDISSPYSTTPVAGTFQRFRITIDHRGNVIFYIDGVQVANHASAVVTSTLMTPVLLTETIAAAQLYNVDYLLGIGGRIREAAAI